MQNRGRVVTRQRLLERVWGYDHPGETRTVDVHISALRAKLGAEVIEARVKELNLGYEVVFPGFLPNEAIPALYAAADAFEQRLLLALLEVRLALALLGGTPGRAGSCGLSCKCQPRIAHPHDLDPILQRYPDEWRGHVAGGAPTLQSDHP